MAGVEAGLRKLNIKKLREKAAAVGVGADQVEDARDGDNPNADSEIASNPHWIQLDVQGFTRQNACNSCAVDRGEVEHH